MNELTKSNYNVLKYAHEKYEFDFFPDHSYTKIL